MKRLTRYLGVLLVGLILASSVMAILPLQNEAHATDMSAWQYYQTIPVQGGNSSSDNYTMVPITIHKGYGASNSTDLYLNWLSSSDNFSDIQVTDSSNNTLSFYADKYSPLEHGGVSNPIYSLLNNPVGLEYTHSGTTYTVVVWQSGLSTLDPYISQFNHTTGNWSFPVKIGTSYLTGDDHGAPNIFIDNLGYFHSIFGSHATSFQYARSANPYDISEWTAMPDINVNGTYQRFLQTPDNKLWLYFRTSAPSTLSFITSVDNGNTWSAATKVIEADPATLNIIYSGNVVYDSNNQTIGVGWAKYIGTKSIKQNIYYAYLNLSDNHMYSMGGNDLGVSVNETEADSYAKVYSSVADNATQFPVERLDQNNVPHIVANIQEGTGIYTEITSWNGSGWNAPTQIVTVFDIFNEYDMRVISSTNITVYATAGGLSPAYPGHAYYNRGGDFTVVSYNGTTWTPNTVLTSQNSSYPMNAPAVVYGSSTDAIVSQVATEQYGSSELQLYYYNGTNITPIIPRSYRIHVKTPTPAYLSSSTIRIWYGNPSAASTSDASATFTKYNDGITGNFTSATLGGGTIQNYPIPTMLQSVETADSHAFAYGVNLTASSTNFSFEIDDVRNATGSYGGVTFYGLVDKDTIAGSLGAAAVVGAYRRIGVNRYNSTFTNPNYFSVFYVNGAGAGISWNGTGWQAAAYTFTNPGPIDIKISEVDNTYYISVTQSGNSAIGNVASIDGASVKAFSTGKTALFGDLYTDFYTNNVKTSGVFLHPYMNPEPTWQSPESISSNVTGVLMDKDGAFSISTNLTDLAGYDSTSSRVQYGTTLAYGNQSTNITLYSIWTSNFSISTNITPGIVTHFRVSNLQPSGTTSFGSDSTFTLTMPSVTTGTVTNIVINPNSATLNGNVSSMGVASNAYVSFQWGTIAYENSTPEVTITGTGNYSANISGFLQDTTLHSRIRVRVGSIYVYGADSSGAVPSTVDPFIGLRISIQIAPFIMFVLWILGGILAYKGLKSKDWTVTAIGMISIIIGLSLFIPLLSSLYTLLTGG